MPTGAQRQRGFTVLEVLVSLVVLAIGTIGILALLSSTIASHRRSRRLERAKALAVQTMEDLRATPISSAAITTRLANVPSPEGVTYYCRYSVTPTGTTGRLAVVSVTAGWIDDQPASEPTDPFAEANFHGARAHMLRTTLEKL